MEKNRSNDTVFRYIFQILRTFPLLTVFFVVAKLFSHWLFPYSFVYLKKLIDRVPLRSFDTVEIFLFVLIYFLIWALRHLSSFSDHRLERRMGQRIASDVVEKTCRIPYAVFEDSSSKDLIERIQNKPEDAVLGYFHNGLDILEVLVELSGFVLLIGRASWTLAAFLILMLFLTCILDAKSMALMNRMFQHQSRKEREVRELESHLKDRDSLYVLRIFDGLKYYVGKYFLHVGEMERERIETTVRANKYVIFIYVMLGVWVLGSIGYSVYLLSRGAISVGLFSVLITSFLSLLSVSERFSYSLSTVLENRFRVRQLVEFMNLSERSEEEKNGVKGEAVISFEEVSFHYPNDERMILQELSFDIRRGERVSIIGKNGSGKTRLLKLLLGLYPPTSGEIRLFGRAIDTYSDEERANFLSVVFQDYVGFQWSIRENVALAHLASKEDDSSIDRALEEAGLDFLKRERKDRTLGKLEEDALELSGGQWQRMAIARALFHEKPLLFFDEPLAASDPMQEALMYRKLFRLSQGRTSVIISHRMGSVKQSDRILVLDDGRIAEDGNHAELMEKHGIYAEFYRTQSLWYEGGAEYNE